MVVELLCQGESLGWRDKSCCMGHNSGGSTVAEVELVKNADMTCAEAGTAGAQSEQGTYTLAVDNQIGDNTGQEDNSDCNAFEGTIAEEYTAGTLTVATGLTPVVGLAGQFCDMVALA